MIPAGVPEQVKVAHKIGISEVQEVYQDCGIVYVPDRPYLLCMMSKSNRQEAQQRMSMVSKEIYSYVSRVNK